MFKMTSKMALGSAEYVFEVEDAKEMDVLHKAIVLTNPRKKCDVCGNKELSLFVLDSNKDKEGNIYVNNVCRACGSKSKLGQYKAGGYFWREFEKYVSGNSAGVNRGDAEEALGA